MLFHEAKTRSLVILEHPPRNVAICRNDQRDVRAGLPRGVGILVFSISLKCHVISERLPLKRAKSCRTETAVCLTDHQEWQELDFYFLRFPGVPHSRITALLFSYSAVHRSLPKRLVWFFFQRIVSKHNQNKQTLEAGGFCAVHPAGWS